MNLLKPTVSEKNFITEVLTHFRNKMPESTVEQRQLLATKTLFRMRLWEVIYQFRVTNYRVNDVLDSEFIDA